MKEITIVLFVIIVLVLSACQTKEMEDNLIEPISKEVQAGENKNGTTIEQKKEYGEVSEENDLTRGLESFNLIDDSVDKEAYFKVKLDDYDRICSKINFPKTRNECYIMAAYLKKNLEICDKVNTSKQLSALDYEECLGSVAYATGDSSICGNIKSPNIKYNCIVAMAVYHEDESYCEQITDNYQIKNSCLSDMAQIQKDPARCKTLKPDDYVDGCYQRLAYITRNLSLCEEIPPEREVVISACKRAMSDKTWWRGECLDLAYNFMREMCFDIQKKNAEELVENTESSLCKDMPDRFNQRDFCYSEVAYATGNEGICDNIPENRTTNRGTCIRAAVFRAKDPSICEKTGSTTEKEYCFITAATMLKDVSICDNMNFTIENLSENANRGNLGAKSIARKNKCYKWVGIELNDPSICKKITVADDRLECIKHVAKAMLNESLCEDTEGVSNIRSSCLTGMFQEEDNWNYDCAWEPGYYMMYNCFYAKDQGILDGMRRHGMIS